MREKHAEFEAPSLALTTAHVGAGILAGFDASDGVPTLAMGCDSH